MNGPTKKKELSVESLPVIWLLGSKHILPVEIKPNIPLFFGVYPRYLGANSPEKLVIELLCSFFVVPIN
uniref:Uncharacterized protein n=1 Tax=Syphacia muris TaxID=451379 RepID=A0A0N5AWN3_9BILA